MPELSHLVAFVRYSGGKLRELEDAALAALARSSMLKSWSLDVIDNWDVNDPLTSIWQRVMRDSRHDLVTYLNSDCFVAPRWDVETVHAFARDMTIGASGPSANMGAQTAGPEIGDVADPTPEALVRASQRCAQFAGQVRDCRIYGFCLTIRRAAWQDVGGFNLAIPLYGADDEFCARLRARAWRTVAVLGAYCWHKGEASARVAEAAGRLRLAEERERGQRLYDEAKPKAP